MKHDTAWFAMDCKKHLEDKVKAIKLLPDQTVISNQAARQRGVVVKYMKEAVKDDRTRRLGLMWLFGDTDYEVKQLSASELTPAQVCALFWWIDAIKMGSVWVSQIFFNDEFRWVCNVAIKVYGVMNVDEQQLDIFDKKDGG